jgi:hypothetical protein
LIALIASLTSAVATVGVALHVLVIIVILTIIIWQSARSISQALTVRVREILDA